MNRNALLRFIAKDLHRDAEGDVAPSLDATVQRVMQAMQGERRQPSSMAASRLPLPLEMVAAYVDGTLTDDEVTQIDHHLAGDPEAMMEIVSAIAAQHPDKRQLSLNSQSDFDESASDGHVPLSAPLPDDLRHRLLAIGNHGPPPITPAASRPPVTGAFPNAARWSIAATIAAMLLGIIAWQFRQPGTPGDIRVPTNNSPMIAMDAPAVQRDEAIDDAFDDATLASPSLDDSPNRDATERLAEQSPLSRPTPPSPDPVLSPMIAPPDAVASDNEMPAPSPPTVMPIREVIPPAAATPKMRRLRWQTISGIVAMRSTPSGSASRRAAWRSVVESETVLISAADDEASTRERVEAVRVKTLPLTRASATWDAGGKWVIDEDSLLVIHVDGSVDLKYGSLALIDTPAGTRWRLGGPTPTDLASKFPAPDMPLQSVELQSVEPGTVIVHRDAGALRVEIQSGQFEINGRPANQQAGVAAIDRMPGWTTRPIQRIDVHRTFLAQLRDTDDLAGTLATQIRQIESGQGIARGAASSLPTLCRWQAASLDDQLYRLMGASSEAVRVAALDRVFSVRNDDPRNAPIWSAMENNVRDPRSVAFVRSLFRLAWQRSTLTPNQVTRLITMLESDTVAARAMADYLLRRFYGGGPRFDPTWTGTTLARAANGWRAWIARQR